MPSRNIVKQDIGQSYYHIYARGANRQPIFLDSFDRNYFIKLLMRYLSEVIAKNRQGLIYPNFNGDLELLAYCLMGNHFHLLVYQEKAGIMSSFMRSLMTSYSRYFNLRHKRTGSPFESRYKASIIESDEYLQHISRYIHLNPRYWKRYAYSSLSYYKNGDEPEWLSTGKILSLFDSRGSYIAFNLDYEAHKEILEEVKNQLADY